MDQVHVVRHKVLVEGRSISAVAREMQMSRNTVRKYLTLSEPKRVVRHPKASPTTELVAPRIEELLTEWRGRTTLKQRITGTRIHRQLLEEGYEVGVTTVRDYLREKRRKEAEVFIPLIHRPGEEAQVDFFEVTIEEDGQFRKAWKFVMRLMYSGRDFIRLYDRADQLSFLDAHVRAFSYLGGVPHRIVYDNLGAAVKRIAGSERQLTERFMALASHYLFEPCFARPGEGHDKGGVEARGKGIRLAHLTPIPRGENLSEVSEILMAEVELAFSEQEKLREELRKMRPPPEKPFEARKVELVSVSSGATVRVDGATYSVPSRWASLRATAYVGVKDVRLVCREQSISYLKERKGGRSIRYRHYLPELAKKPQALRQVAPELVRELGSPYEKLWEMLTASHGPKEASRVLSRILGATLEHGEEAVTEALEAALAQGRCDLLSLGKHLREDGREQVGSVEVPEALCGYRVEAARAKDYDWLLEADSSETRIEDRRLAAELEGGS
ncbi:MAG: IS21 family transposase [Actinobacteria bacterium]|nr:IS21 family transposase [Actinomycetota bacterium]